MRRAAFAVLAALALIVPAAPAAAAPAKVTWTVQPAGKAGPDGRRWIEHTLDPGATRTEHLAVRNFGDAPAVFALKAADGYLTDKGRFNMLPSDRKSVDGGTWISVQSSVTVGPGQTKVVPFTITVPADATPGDHPAGIAAAIAGKQGTVSVESRVGFRLLLRASGELKPSLATADVTAHYERSWNPLKPGALRVDYSVANDGNVRVGVRGRAEASSLFGAVRSSTGNDLGELLPGGSTAASARIDGVWALGRVRTTLTFAPTVPGEATARGPVTVTVTTWAGPWPQLLLALAVAALVAGLLTMRRRKRARLERLLDEARRQGRESAGRA